MEVDAPKGIWQSDNKKKEKNNNKKKKKQEIGQNFLIDFLFFIPHEKKNLYISEKKWTDRRIGSR